MKCSTGKQKNRLKQGRDCYFLSPEVSEDLLDFMPDRPGSPVTASGKRGVRLGSFMIFY